ncbi:unnamed protein product, partial [Polarella glacialis]
MALLATRPSNNNNNHNNKNRNNNNNNNDHNNNNSNNNNNNNFVVWAHRGASAERPENSLSAFRRALELGADGVELELDVHLSADGHAVVIHDSWLDRTTGSSGPVGALPLDELRRVSLLPGASLPTTTTVTTTTTTMPIGQQQQQQTSATDAADVT